MKVAVLEVLSDSVREHWNRRIYNRTLRRHYASIMPQVVSVWCRQLGADVWYGTYYGQREPHTLVPDDVDVLFVSTYTHASIVAYALARIFKERGALTVIGGPHARSFPADCLRFFDLVVQHCDKALIGDILKRRHEPGTVVTSARPPVDLPMVEERLPEILRASGAGGRRPPLAANIALLSSYGCPYTCDFCIDWNQEYTSVSADQLRVDLQFIARRLPGIYVTFHDPNFGVSFDATLGAIESLPPADRAPYFMESSLSILKGPRLKRLQETRCFYVAPGLESWGDYSGKAGVPSLVGAAKLERVVSHLQEIHEHVPNIQANFIFGTDADAGDDPVALTEEFMRRAPYAWPVVNIPTPYGGTPLYDRQLRERRIHQTMPFTFYFKPHLVMTLRNYSTLDFYDRLIRLHACAYSWEQIRRRIGATRSASMRVFNLLRAASGRAQLAKLRRMRARLENDAGFRAYHEGEAVPLPAYYRDGLTARLGPYRRLLSDSDLTPVFG